MSRAASVVARLPQLEHPGVAPGRDVRGGAETNPAPPSASSGRQSSSMPDQTSSSRPHAASTREKCSKSLVVSLIPTKLSTSREEPGHRLRGRCRPRSGRHVVGDDRQVGELGGDRRVPDVQRLLGGPGVVRGDDQRRVGAERRGPPPVSSMVSSQLGRCRCRRRPAPGRRPSSATVRIAATRSSMVCALGSPVEPPIEMPCVPWASCQLTRLARLSWSTSPSAVNGVTSGAIEPVISLRSGAVAAHCSPR